MAGISSDGVQIGLRGRIFLNGLFYHFNVLPQAGDSKVASCGLKDGPSLEAAVPAERPNITMVFSDLCEADADVRQHWTS